jgi:hypothetical protein
MTEAYYSVGQSILEYLDASTGCVVHDLYGYARKRLQDMFNNTRSYLYHMMDRYSDEGDDSRTKAAHALRKAKDALLRYADFDFDAVTAESIPTDEFMLTWHSQADHHKHSTRMRFIEDMDPVAQTYHAEVLYWFWMHKGFGKRRLTELYGALRRDYNLLVTEYLRCSFGGDQKIKELLAQRQDKLYEMGMEFVEV